MKSKKIVSLFILFLAIGYSNSVSSQNQLDYKVMMGYQGWFLAPGDGSTTNNPWSHWFRGGTAATPDAANLTVDMWPDMSEYTDKFNTNMTYANGSNAQLFSSYSLSTTRKHFEWMSNYNVHGIYLQRFLSAVELQTSGMFRAKNKVLNNVMTSAAEYNRKYAVMYDVSGVTDATMYAKIVADWEYLVNTYDILNKPEYVKQNGKPVVAIWGIGFKNRGLTTATSQAIIDYFKTNAAPQYRAYVMGGVPEHWRTLSGSSETGSGWTAVYNSLDMISPWSVGRYSNNNGADSFKTNNIVPDLAACNNNNKDYMPVIWPGFSWKNLKSNSTPPSIETLNTIPRNGGQFYWRQAYNAVQAGVKFIYVAMFDEVDEGTAMFKITDITAKLPIQANDRLVSLDIDGVNLPSDWYLKLADQSQKMLNGTIPLTRNIPLTPPVTLAGNGAEFITQQNVPTLLRLNQNATVNVTMKNIGLTTWTKASGYKLGSQNTQDNTVWGFNRVDLSDTDAILPGQEKTFQFEITAPSSAGYNNFQWKLIKEGLEWFGELTPNIIIAIGEGGNYLDDCDAKTNWNPSSLVLNNINQIQGLNSLEYTGSATPEYSKVFPTPYNTVGSGTGATLQFWYYVSDVSMIQTNNYLEIGSSGVPDSNEYQWTLTGLVNGWNFIQLNTADASITGGTPNLSAINWFRIYGVKTGSITTRIDAIQLLGNSTLSTDSFNEENSLTIYPNPADSEVYINFSLPEPSDVGISIINFTGQIVLQNSDKKKLDSGSHTIKVALNTLSKGVYLARININNRVFVRKVIIE
jgi:hypothetical protein